MWCRVARKLHKNDLMLTAFVFLVGFPAVVVMKGQGVFETLDRLL